jgi:predicted porin
MPDNHMKIKGGTVSKKNILGLLTLSAISGISFAQSNVTVFGRIDANVEYVNNSPVTGGGGGSAFKLNSGGLSGSRWGMEGTEELDGALKAFYRLEGGFNVDSGTLGQGGRLFGRGAYVGLKGGFGELRVGRQYTTMFDLMEPYSIDKYPNLYEPAVQWVGTSFREDNMVKYISRTGPITAEAHYAFGEVAGSNSASAAYGAGIGYSNDPFSIGLVYDDVNSAPSAAGVVTRARKVSGAAAYNFGRIRLFGGYRWGKNDVAAAGLPLRDNFYFAGINYQATPVLKLSAAYYYDQLNSTTPTASGAATANPQTVTVIGTYSLSKRTDLYVTAGYAKNSALNFDSLDGSATGYALAPGSNSQTGVALGIRHYF